MPSSDRCRFKASSLRKKEILLWLLDNCPLPNETAADSQSVVEMITLLEAAIAAHPARNHRDEHEFFGEVLRLPGRSPRCLGSFHQLGQAARSDLRHESRDGFADDPFTVGLRDASFLADSWPRRLCRLHPACKACEHDLGRSWWT